MRNKYNLTSVSFSKEDEDSAIEFSKEFISCKRLDALLKKYKQKKLHVIEDRLLQEHQEELQAAL